MEELEDPTERLKETFEAYEEKNEEREKWTLHVALSTAVIAVLAAIAGLLGDHHANEAVLEQIRSSNQWSYYQSKSIKYELAANTATLLTAMDKPVQMDSLQKKMARYDKDKEAIRGKAEDAEKSSEEHLHKHIVISMGVTIFQVAIAISAIAILTRRKALWIISMVLTAAGCVFFVIGVLAH